MSYIIVLETHTNYLLAPVNLACVRKYVMAARAKAQLNRQ